MESLLLSIFACIGTMNLDWKHRTFNIERRRTDHSMLGVRCSMFDVSEGSWKFRNGSFQMHNALADGVDGGLGPVFDVELGEQRF